MINVVDEAQNFLKKLKNSVECHTSFFAPKESVVSTILIVKES